MVWAAACGGDDNDVGANTGSGGARDAGHDVRTVNAAGHPDGAGGTSGNAGAGGSTTGTGGSGGTSVVDAAQDREVDAEIAEDTGTPDVTVDVSSPDDSSTADSAPSDVNVSESSTDAAPEAEAGPPNCDDEKATTQDFYNPPYGCGHKFDLDSEDNQAWIVYDAGFSVDVPTGRGWAQLNGFRSLDAAKTACEGFSVAGLTDWRLPTIDDARSLAGGCPKTALGGSCPISDAEGRLGKDSSGYLTGECESCYGLAGPHSGGYYCKVDTTICFTFHTTSICSDCITPGDWRYGPINGNFYSSVSGEGIPTVCVTDVPGGIP
jgi:hypothetical protein